MTPGSWTDPTAGNPTDLVHLAGLGVDYGPRRALDDVNLHLPGGEVFGLLGPNGAGKSTLFRVLATLLAPTRGRVEIGGAPLPWRQQAIRSTVAYMPDLAPLPSDLQAVEYLRFFAEAYGLRGAARDRRVEECLDAVGLRDRARDIGTQLSLGLRQRLALAKAILHRPRLLILDEPASGLDPVARVELRTTLRRQADEGATVVLSSHVMADIQELCSSIGLLQGGRLLAAGPLREVLARFGQAGTRLVVQAPHHREAVAAKLAAMPGLCVDPLPPDVDSIRLVLDEAVLSRAALFTALGEAQLGVTGLHAVETTVEEVIIRLGRPGKS